MAFPLRALQPLVLSFLDVDQIIRATSRIVDFTEGKEIIVDVPYREGDEVLVPIGTVLEVEVTQADAIRRFPSRVLGRLPMRPPCLQLEWPDEIERIQRRNDVRVAAALKVEMEFHPQEGGRSTLRGETSDISAGGLRIVTPEAVPEGISVLVRLFLPSNEMLLCRGEVLRGGEIQLHNNKTARWAALRFTEVSERDRRELTKLVFDIQRELLRRG